MAELESEDNLLETVLRLKDLIVGRRCWILLAACAVTLSTAGVLRFIPNRYKSTATLLVIQQQIPQRYVVPNSTTDPESELAAMKEEVLSRTRLLALIEQFGLYTRQKRRLTPEEVAALMLKDIDIDPFGSRQKDFDGFKISFVAENPLVAQQVTGRLTSLFIEENMRTREQQSSNTTRFLREQSAAKRRQLEENEQRLRDFKMEHVGELPEQQHGNLEILSGLQARLQNVTAGIYRAQQQRAYLQSLLEPSRRRPVGTDGTSTSSPATQGRMLTAVEAAQTELANLEKTRAALLAKYTPDYPDVSRAQREIVMAQERLRQLRAKASASEQQPAAGEPPVKTPSPRLAAAETEDPAVAQVKSQLAANRFELDALSRDEKDLKAAIGEYEQRLNRTPVREQQMSALLRDTEALRNEYAELEKKEEESQLATNLERQQGGQQFRLIDRASLPLAPSSPKRLQIGLGAAAAGLLLGIVFVFVMDVKNTSFRAEQDVEKYLSPPFIVGVPILATADEKRAREWKARVERTVTAALGLILVAAELFVRRSG